MSHSPESSGGGRTVGRARGRTNRDQFKEDRPGSDSKRRRESRDFRDSREHRERDHRESRERSHKESRERDHRESRDRDYKESRDARELRESRESRVARDEYESRERRYVSESRPIKQEPSLERIESRNDYPRAPSCTPSIAATEIAPGTSAAGRPRISRRRPIRGEVAFTRPPHLKDKRGISGHRLMLQANYFNLRSLTDWTLYQYHINFEPAEERPGIRKALVKQQKSVLGPYIFDGALLFSSHRLRDPLELVSVRQGDNAEIALKITYTRQLALGDIEYLQFFNILMRKCLGALKLQLVGRHFYDPLGKVSISQFKLELWPGYITSIRQHENDILMCAEITHKVMRLETVDEVFSRCQNNCDSVEELRRDFKDSVLGLVVLTDYNNRTYRVDDVNFDVTPKSTFPLKDRIISYADYYYEKYKIEIKNMYQPLLVSKSKSHKMKAGSVETVYLVPELCRMTGLNDDMRTNFHLMRAVAEYTRVGPQGRIQKLLNFSRRLMGEQEVFDEMEQWNMAVNNKLVQFEGRQLEPETIVQGYAGRDISHQVGYNADWTKSLRANPLLNLRELQEWVVMCPRNMQRDVQKFIRQIIQAAQGMSMYMSEPQFELIDNDRKSTYINALDDMLSCINPQLVLCVVSNNHPERYSAIKKKCLVERSVPTQILTGKSLNNKGAMSIATKVAIQINCKIGGAPWTIVSPCKSEMVVGFDVSHNTRDRRITYGAFVASLNRTFSRWYSTVSAHSSPEELSEELSENMLKALQQFRVSNNGMLPARIIIYRDGVGDGQIDYVCKVEVDKLKEKLIMMYGSEDRFRLTFIIVCKRINTRIFLANNENPQPGTVVDDCITLPERFDFFLVSQSVRQGTVSPTSYNVVYDTSGFTPDQIQQFTYKMTHLYYNWSGTVRVPAPVQYAHKLAMLVGQSLHNVPSDGLSDTLYFL